LVAPTYFCRQSTLVELLPLVFWCQTAGLIFGRGYHERRWFFHPLIRICTRNTFCSAFFFASPPMNQKGAKLNYCISTATSSLKLLLLFHKVLHGSTRPPLWEGSKIKTNWPKHFSCFCSFLKTFRKANIHRPTLFPKNRKVIQ